MPVAASLHSLRPQPGPTDLVMLPLLLPSFHERPLVETKSRSVHNLVPRTAHAAPGHCLRLKEPTLCSLGLMELCVRGHLLRCPHEGSNKEKNIHPRENSRNFR